MAWTRGIPIASRASIGMTIVQVEPCLMEVLVICCIYSLRPMHTLCLYHVWLVSLLPPR